MNGDYSVNLLKHKNKNHYSKTEEMHESLREPPMENNNYTHCYLIHT